MAQKVVSTFDMNSAAALHLQGVGQTLQSPNTGESLQSCGSMRCCLLLPTAWEGRKQVSRLLCLCWGLHPQYFDITEYSYNSYYIV